MNCCEHEFEPPFHGHTPSHYHPVPAKHEEDNKKMEALNNAEIYAVVSKVFEL